MYKTGFLFLDIENPPADASVSNDEPILTRHPGVESDSGRVRPTMGMEEPTVQPNGQSVQARLGRNSHLAVGRSVNRPGKSFKPEHAQKSLSDRGGGEGVGAG